MCMNRVSPRCLTRKQRRRLEGQMRVAAFHAFYRRDRSAGSNPLVRFVRAIVASGGRIRDKAAFAQWCEMQLRPVARRKRGICKAEAAG